MTKSRNVLGWTNLALLSLSLACGSDDSPAKDSGTPDSGKSDSGTFEDSGLPITDSGLPNTDSGVPNTDSGMGDAGMGDGGPGGGGDDQTPPQGKEALNAWLQTGAYKKWRCEDKVHPPRRPVAHTANKICSNNLVSANAEGMGEWPVGAAAVKELYATANDKTVNGYAVYLKTKAESQGGANWYWYEIIANTVVADGLGDSGQAKTLCVGCHSGAGNRGDVTPGARDYVYTPVP